MQYNETCIKRPLYRVVPRDKTMRINMLLLKLGQGNYEFMCFAKTSRVS